MPNGKGKVGAFDILIGNTTHMYQFPTGKVKINEMTIEKDVIILYQFPMGKVKYKMTLKKIFYILYS